MNRWPFLLNGSEQISFEEIYRNHWKKLYLYALKFTGDPKIAEDLTKEVFLYFLEKNEEKEINNPAAYLLSALRYQCFNWQRHNRVAEQQLNHVQNGSAISAESDANYQFAIDDIKRLVSDMPEKYREVFELGRFENLPSDEIAQKLAIAKLTGSDLLTRDATIEDMLDESPRELFGESNRWMDLKRAGTLLTRAVQHNAFCARQHATAIDARYLVRPIPLTEIVRSPTWTQNSGYPGI